MPNVKRIDHIAILTEDLDTALGFWRDGLGLEVSHMEEEAGEGAQIAFLPVGGSQVELVRSIKGDSGLARYLEKRGPGMHHLCLEVDDLVGMLSRLKAHGIQLINETPVSGTDGKKYAFIHPKSTYGVLLELYELPE